ncbi:metallophosphoesterase [Candidatus Aciduliprofundum boonei]|uniref:Phosphodiesterase, MJ0936 family n=1 Tax=Aciduliprofundum boonei (strain DSM 19572 / T469) TaxID=439481 RepID=B5ID53_ACIB4|nr:metallophosphoesterase [Candidatus Aciduliprofundum boonei]ADD09180.1 phosphodiesterase, MJ0936 family [Aciduliprofundum boonei T469]EDY35842.1 phosphodiesterase, MJ0936 family [Aciduliprofundum boonei T469]HII55856.1 phosphodiesterase [Candidatus Aciduliprofundum boonei]
MKLLAIADIHGAWNVLYLIEEFDGLYNFDAVLIAGDITNFGPAEFALDFLNEINKPTFAIPGNCDPPDVLDAIEKSKAVNLHKKEFEFGGLHFIGLGGTNGIGFTMGITFQEDYAYKFLSRCKECVFLLHQPPYGILDDVGSHHIGSEGIRKAVFEAKPKIVISGHVHEARGYFKTEDTLFVNPGPAKSGYAAIVDTENFSVRLLEK